MAARSLAGATLLVAALAGCFGGAGRVPHAEDLPAPPRRDLVETFEIIEDLDFSSDSRYCAFLCGNGDVIVWDVVGGEKLTRERTPGTGSQHLVVGSRRKLAIRDQGRIRIWDLVDRTSTDIPVADDAPPFMQFDSSIDRLATTDGKGDVVLLDTITGARLRVVATGLAALGASDPGDWRVLPGPGFGALFLLGASRVHVVSFDAEKPGVTLELSRPPDGPVAVSRDGFTLANVAAHGTVEIRGLPGGELRRRLEGLQQTPRALALSPDGSVLAIEVGEAAVELWDTARGERIDQVETPVRVEDGLLFSPNGNFLAWVEHGRRKVRFWNVVDGVVKWEDQGSYLISEARAVCHNLADIVRYRLAMPSFQRGRGLLEAGRFSEGRIALDAAQGLFPAFPGLEEALAEIGRSQAEKTDSLRRFREVARLETTGDLVGARKIVEEFLANPNLRADSVYSRRAQGLLEVFGKLERSRGLAAQGKNDESAVVLEEANRLVARLAEDFPGYQQAREERIAEIVGEAREALESRDAARAVAILEGVRELRALRGQELLLLARARESLGDDQVAQGLYEQIRPSSEAFSGARRRLAAIRTRAGDLEGARADLERAREIRPGEPAIEEEYARVLSAIGEPDLAIEVWRELGNAEPQNPTPHDSIAGIEEKRENWSAAAAAHLEAHRRSGVPASRHLLRAAECLAAAGDRQASLERYLTLLEAARKVSDDSGLGGLTVRGVENRIRELGFVRHGGEWVPRDRFLSAQGWVQRGSEWLLPREARFREVIAKLETREAEVIRNLTEERYRQEASREKLAQGMNRSEVIAAWGYFDDQNVIQLDGGQPVYEQLIFPDGREAYLRDGVVCSWSE